MSKNKASKRSTPDVRILVLGGVLALAAILVLVFLQLGQGGPSTVSAGGLISPAQYQSTFSSTPHLLVDVRTEEEFSSGHIADAVNISLQTLESRLSEIPTDQPVVLYCRSGNRSAQAMQILRAAGYTQIYDLGGIIDWQAQGYPVE